ncbi:MAG: SDR family oxidoreductase [Myxococcota bacterium]|nr:SDR family oxidoreductase [Myxococcota bacterium]
MSLSGRIALVTGASRGIGQAIALALAEDGADVAVHYNRDRAGAEDTARRIEKLGQRAFVGSASLEDGSSLQKLIDDTLESLGPIDILINNAGVASRGLPVSKTEPEELERVMKVHALAPHALCRLVLPGMRKAERGDIIMISSAATAHHGANGAPYNMAKSAMESLAFTLSKEERHHGIRVNVVAPGLVETEMGLRLMKAVAGVESLREVDSSMPYGRVIQPDDIADAVRHLISSRSSYVNGQRLYVDGGGA